MQVILSFSNISLLSIERRELVIARMRVFFTL